VNSGATGNPREGRINGDFRVTFEEIEREALPLMSFNWGALIVIFKL